MSTLNVANITDGTDTVETGYVVNGSAKAWARYDGASVLADSFNIASTVDSGSTVGQTTVNFTNSMSDGNYASQATCNGTSSDRFTTINNQTSSSYDTFTFDGASRFELPVGTMVTGDIA